MLITFFKNIVFIKEDVLYLYITKNKLNMKDQKYPNGFLPKIQYWNEQFGIKMNEGKLDEAQQCLNKMNYFIIRQKELISKK